MNSKVDKFLAQNEQWKEEMNLLRDIALDCLLTEELKWGVPCYTLNGKNIVLIHGFKEYCAFLFFKGALLKDPENLLIIQSENVQSARQIRFTGKSDILGREALLKSFILEAIEVEKSGLKVTFKKTNEFPLVEEFAQKLQEIPELKKAFEALTPGRQRAYLLFFAAPKQAKTRELRIEKCMNAIFLGKGLND